MSQVLPPNPYAIKKRFWDFLKQPQFYGFNTAFARWLKHKDDSTVSKWHSPTNMEVPGWIVSCATKLDAAARADLAVARFALSLLSEAVEAHAPKAGAVSVNGFDATYFDLKATLARYEDGLATLEEVEAAKARHAEATARVSPGVREKVTVFAPEFDMRNLG